MKEVMAVIRMNKVNQTKQALLKAGFPSITCRKVLGRGKKKIDYALIQEVLNGVELQDNQVAEQLSEGHRLIPKRLFTMVVKDEEAGKAAEVIMSVNSTGNPGDGKIFILPLLDVIRVRTGESGEEAI